MEKRKRAVGALLTAVIAIVLFFCMHKSSCMASESDEKEKGQTGTEPPSIELIKTGQNAVLQVHTDAPMYIVEWDTDESFQHKAAFALYQGRSYDAKLYRNDQKSIKLAFPAAGKCYYVRVYNVEQGQEESFVLGSVSSCCQIDLRQMAEGQTAGYEKKQMKINAPKIKAVYLKKKKSIKVTVSLPKTARGYMLECSTDKSFCHKKDYLLHQDDGTYMVVWNPGVSKRQYTITLPITEFSGNHVYIRAYVMGEEDMKGDHVLSKPSGIARVKWSAVK